MHVAAFAVPSSLGEDEIKVTVSSDIELRPQDLADFARESLPRFMCPRFIEVVDEMPLTPATHKIQRHKLRENWSNANTWDCLEGVYIAALGEALA